MSPLGSVKENAGIGDPTSLSAATCSLKSVGIQPCDANERIGRCTDVKSSLEGPNSHVYFGQCRKGSQSNGYAQCHRVKLLALRLNAKDILWEWGGPRQMFNR